MKKKLTAIFVAVCATLAIPLSLAGCADGSDVVKINEVTHSVFYAPMYLAEALGYYEDEGFRSAYKARRQLPCFAQGRTRF